MRRFVVAVLGGLVLLATSLAGPAPSHAATPAKVVVVVGYVSGMTAEFTAAGQAFAAEASKYTSDVTLFIGQKDPAVSTWSKVAPALQGANIVFYAGHGNGIPSPYHPNDLIPTATEQKTADGMGLDLVTNPTTGKASTVYYGEYYFRTQIKFAPNAVVILNKGCYTAGNSEWGSAPTTLLNAQHRVDNFAAGFIAAGAKAVIAEVITDPKWYLNQLFNAHSTIDQVWRAHPSFHNNVTTFPSWRPTPDGTTFTDAMDPCTSTTCGAAGETRYRSLVSIPTLKTDDVISGVATPPPPPPPSIGTESRFVPLTPARILDTRDGTGLSGALQSNVARTFDVGGHGGVPADAVAVTGNLTVTRQTSAGYLAIGPIATSFPSTSTLNFPKGDNRANGVTVALGSNATLSVTFAGSAGSTAHAIFDVTGYFTTSTTAARYVALTPNRLVDSRAPAHVGLTSSLATGVAATFHVTEQSADPAKKVPAGAVAVTGNLTVTGQTSAGYFALGPVATNSPTTSTLNFPLGDTRANNVTVALAKDGTLSLTFVGAAGSTADVVFDVTGYLVSGTSGASYFPLTPNRLVDSRSSARIGLTSSLVTAVAATFQVTGRSTDKTMNVPTNAIAVTGNLTVTGQTSSGYLALGPVATNSPTTSTLNFPTGESRANGVAVALGAGGKLSLTFVGASGSTTNAIFDVTGYFLPAGG